MTNAALLALFALISLAIIRLDAFEAVYVFSRGHESWELDELISLLPAALVVLSLKLMIGRRSLHKEISRRIAAEKALGDANAELQAHKEDLERRVEEKTGMLQETNARLSGEISEKESIHTELLRSMEETRQANEAKGQFLTVMSHEIRPPLHGLIGMVRLAAENPDGEESRHYLGLAVKAGQNLADLINDTLDLLRMESGKMSLHSQDFSLREALEDVVVMLRPLALAKSLDLSTHIPASIPDELRGDLGKFTQILTNLIGNAIRFTHEGSVRVHVCCTAESGEGPVALRVDVEDTGIGIPADRLEGLFDAFTQAHDNHATYGGTGLGLAISRRLAEMLGGRIEVESTPGTGSRFTLMVAFRPGELLAPHNAASNEAAVAGLSILLAEDNEINQLYMSSLLSRQGHAVSIARNGVDVIGRLRSGHFDIVLMDLEMPDMDGIASTKAIRRGEAGEKNRDIPIVALTAHALDDHRLQTLEAGMNAFLSKPLSPSALNQTLAALIPLQQR